MEIKNLCDLKNLRSAPELSNGLLKKLLNELEPKLLNADWITVGIMARSDHEAINALKSLLKKYNSITFIGFDSLRADGSVFLKANQKTGNVFIRSENGLGEGILLTCQYEMECSEALTYGPFPLDFFTN